jgi:hypothetical protein
LAEPLDRMFDEADRQLAEVRDEANGIATRAGLLVSVTALAAAVFAADLDTLHSGEIVTFVLLGAALLAALAAVTAYLKPGPDALSLKDWAADAPGNEGALYVAKLTQLSGNRTRLVVMRLAFYLQVVTVIAAVVAAIAAAAGR